MSDPGDQTSPLRGIVKIDRLARLTLKCGHVVWVNRGKGYFIGSLKRCPECAERRDGISGS